MLWLFCPTHLIPLSIYPVSFLNLQSPPVKPRGSKKTVPHPLGYVKSECHFSNGTEQVQFLERLIYNQEEYSWFVGEYRAVTELGHPALESYLPLHFNSQKDILEWKLTNVNTHCRYNYRVMETFILQRRVGHGPKASVYPSKTSSLGSTQATLKTSFLSDQEEEEEARIVSIGLLQNGDWDFQTLVMLETVPQSGEAYTCQVKHPNMISSVTLKNLLMAKTHCP
uniref:MHC class II beta chain N-terminal domain-containing protein n=1 Tax=Castor canadensis TaxID=51338 RepID=A0A8C0WTQ3_CASCN